MDRNCAGVAFTLRDDRLRTDAEDLKKKYLQKYANEVTEAEVTAARTSKTVDELRNKFECKTQSWWVSVLVRASKLHKIDDLVARIKDDLIVYASKRKNTGSMANTSVTLLQLDFNV